jgi:uncharacterized protein (DUF2267 family)
MTTTGLDVFDTTLHKTNLWLKDIMVELGTEDRHRAYLALRAAIHAMRDRLSVQAAADLGAQLPMLIRGLYFEGWTPRLVPVKARHKEDFLLMVRARMKDVPLHDYNPEQIARAVLRVITRHTSVGEVEKLKRGLPNELRDLWV